jgi:hypothetical protein
MKMIGRVLVTAVLLGALAAPGAAEIKQVQMKIAGYLCGN